MFLRCALPCVVRSLNRPLSSSVHLTEYGIKDGARELLHAELRNLCRCEDCFGKHSHQTGLPDAQAEVRVTGIGPVSEHYLSLSWDDGHEGIVARTTRGAHGPEPLPSLLEKYYDLTMRRSTALELWKGQEKESGKMFPYHDVIASDQNTRDFLAHFMRYGIGSISHVPADVNTLDVVNRDMKAGPMRNTIYNAPDVVELKADAINAAYTTNALQGHTDLAYYDQV